MLLNRAQIAALIPHGEGMCMLDEVVSWDADQIHCRSIAFAVPSNPLFENGCMESVILIEYAAQAAAVHAALLQSELGEARSAYIGAVKNVELLKPLVDNTAAIDIEAQGLLNNSSGAIYQVQALQQGEPIMRGRLILNQV